MTQNEYILRETPNINYLVSLGYNCAVAYQIRMHTGIRESMLFDWLFTSISAAIGVMKTDFTNILSLDRMHVVNQDRQVYVEPCGIRLVHSFKPNGVTIDKDVMVRDFPKEKEKFNYMGGKMRSLLASEAMIGFVYYSPYEERIDPPLMIQHLETCLSERVGRHRFVLFWIRRARDQGVVRLSPNTIAVDLPEDASRSRSFKGGAFIGTDDVAWGRLISNLNLDLWQETGPVGIPPIDG